MGCINRDLYAPEAARRSLRNYSRTRYHISLGNGAPAARWRAASPRMPDPRWRPSKPLAVLAASGPSINPLKRAALSSYPWRFPSWSTAN